MIDTFADLYSYLQSSERDKTKIWIVSDEGIVYVYEGDTQIFNSEEVHFVNAFFTLCGIDVDSNIEARTEAGY